MAAEERDGLKVHLRLVEDPRFSGFIHADSVDGPWYPVPKDLEDAAWSRCRALAGETA